MSGRQRTTEQLFPHWITARDVLTAWAASVEGWDVAVDFSRKPPGYRVTLKSDQELFKKIPAENQPLFGRLLAPLLQPHLDAAHAVAKLGLEQRRSERETIVAIKETLAGHDEVEGPLRDCVGAALGLFTVTIGGTE